MMGMMEEAYAAYQAALATIAASAALAVWGERDSDDKELIEAHDLILDTLSDADKRAKLGCIAGVDLGRELTVEDAERMEEERRLARMGKRRN